MKFTQFTFAALIAFLLATTISCTEKITRTAPEVPEPTFCSTTQSYSPSYTMSGTAIYQKRPITSNGLANSTNNMPIRKAEMKIVDSSGNTVQCAETSDTGTFSFTVPQSGATYTIKVLSRANHTNNKASVLKDPDTNVPHEISTTVVASSNQPGITITAPAASAGSLTAGAFNILDQIYTANLFLVNNSGGAFSVTTKVQAYWDKGVNPVTYFGGDPDEGVSFYVPGTDKLYILGGINGDVTVMDTDHFDDSVIIHEFGHFVEDNYAITDSPGGAHYGTYAVDPRLAWSEAFATFLATQALVDPVYKDTKGIYTGPGTGGFGFYYDVEDNLDAPSGGSAKDMPTAGALGEGNFRELAVLRFLWHAIDNTAFSFSEFWDIFTNEFLSTDPFREMSLYLKQQAAHGSTNLSSMYADNDKEMDATRAHYGTKDNTGTANADSANCRWTIQASDKLPSYAGSSAFERSNPYYSNDFFHYYHSGGNLNVSLVYDRAGATSADLDLYIYKTDYSYGVGSDLLTYSNKSRCPGTNCESANESVSVSAAAGHYMINVMYYNDGPSTTATVYNLIIGGSNYICR